MRQPDANLIERDGDGSRHVQRGMTVASRAAHRVPETGGHRAEVELAELIALRVNARTERSLDRRRPERSHGFDGPFDDAGLETPPPGVGGTDHAF